MNNRPSHPSLSLASRWRKKFGCAFRGLRVGTRDQNSFRVHFFVAIAVVALATWLQVSQWPLLMLCIAVVFSAELFNTAIEHLARAITPEEHPEIRDALDVASGAVLVAAIGAGIVGLMVLGCPLLRHLG